MIVFTYFFKSVFNNILVFAEVSRNCIFYFIGTDLFAHIFLYWYTSTVNAYSDKGPLISNTKIDKKINKYIFIKIVHSTCVLCSITSRAV